MKWIKSIAKGCFLQNRCLGLALSHRDAQTKEGRRGGIQPALPVLELNLSAHFGVVPQQYFEGQQPPQL